MDMFSPTHERVFREMFKKNVGVHSNVRVIGRTGKYVGITDTATKKYEMRKLK